MTVIKHGIDDALSVQCSIRIATGALPELAFRGPAGAVDGRAAAATGKRKEAPQWRMWGQPRRPCLTQSDAEHAGRQNHGDITDAKGGTGRTADHDRRSCVRRGLPPQRGIQCRLLPRLGSSPPSLASMEWTTTEREDASLSSKMSVCAVPALHYAVLPLQHELPVLLIKLNELKRGKGTPTQRPSSHLSGKQGISGFPHLLAGRS